MLTKLITKFHRISIKIAQQTNPSYRIEPKHQSKRGKKKKKPEREREREKITAYWHTEYQSQEP